MKSIVTALAFVFILTGVNASELKNNLVFLNEINEVSLDLESWMIDSELFNLNESETASGTVVEIAVSNPDFSILVEAVSKAGLVDALSAEGPFTVFAPTNAAFGSLFSQLGVKGISDLTVDQLMPILTYHVVSGKVMSTDLTNGEVDTLNKDSKLRVDLAKGVKINESNVVTADIQGENGVIHVIDKVLLPQ